MARVNDTAFQDKHKNKMAPLAMVAFADAVMESIVNNRAVRTEDYFDVLTMTVPACDSNNNPYYHSIVGQKLLLVDWTRLFGIAVPCTEASCTGTLENDRTNFSKNKTLFPIFDLVGAPSWCIVQSMICTCCRRRHDANTGEVLVALPPFASEAYPVEPKFALSNKSCHIAETATAVFDLSHQNFVSHQNLNS